MFPDFKEDKKKGNLSKKHFKDYIYLVKADKSSNIYKMNPNKYKQMLHKEVTKHYQKAQLNLEN